MRFHFVLNFFIESQSYISLQLLVFRQTVNVVVKVYTFTVVYSCSGVLVQVDSNDSSEVRQASEYFGTLPGLRPIKTALLDDGLLLIYESSKSKRL